MIVKLYVYRFNVYTIFIYLAHSATKLSDSIYNSLNFDRFLALIAFLCWCAVKHQTNNSWTRLIVR